MRFVTTSAGSPARFMAPLKTAGIAVHQVVPTLGTALTCVDAGIDRLVVEGSEGGGFKQPEKDSMLVPLHAIREREDVPLIAAGAIVAAEAEATGAASALDRRGSDALNRRHMWSIIMLKSRYSPRQRSLRPF